MARLRGAGAAAHALPRGSGCRIASGPPTDKVVPLVVVRVLVELHRPEHAFPYERLRPGASAAAQSGLGLGIPQPPFPAAGPVEFKTTAPIPLILANAFAPFWNP